MQRLIRTYLPLFFFALPFAVVSQEVAPPSFSNPARLQIGINSQFYRFKGDNSFQRISGSAINPGFELAAEHKSWKFFVPLSPGNISWNKNGPDTLHNYKTRFFITGLNAQFRLSPNTGKLSPFVGIGYNLIFFSVSQDLKNEEELNYYLWKDGKIRNLPQTPENQDKAKQINRDYTYETRVLRNQRMTCYPVSFGINSELSEHWRLSLSYSFILLQGDNLDYSVSKKGWDKLSSFQVGLNWTIPPAKRSVWSGKPPEKEIDYSNVDFTALFSEDEDGDGVSDVLDQCYGTPKGAPVDSKGCTPDSDSDGISDFLDQEPQSKPDSRIHPNGVAWSDEEYLRYANDSLSYFVGTLRKNNKNSRPFPVKKYIPTSAYLRWAEILENNPEWVRQRAIVPSSLPDEYKVFDLNQDGFLSLSEMEQSVNDIFDNRKSGVNEALIRKAIEYAFRNQ